jgi:hypothetical protein
MKTKEIIDEMFDISKFQQAKKLQQNIEKIDQFVKANPGASKEIAGASAEAGSSFASLLAASQAALQQEAEEKKSKEAEVKKKAATLSNSRAGIGTTIPITSNEEPKENDKAK